MAESTKVSTVTFDGRTVVNTDELLRIPEVQDRLKTVSNRISQRKSGSASGSDVRIRKLRVRSGS